ncbi:hypothetical protein D046_5175B, partial [Vibrio parahaemolyticus V-223/04]
TMNCSSRQTSILILKR